MDLLAAIFDNPIDPIKTIPELIEKLLKIAVVIAIPLVTIFIVYAGFLFVSARGNEQQITKAKSVLTWAIVGAVFIIGAWAFATAIVGFFKNTS